MIKKGQLSEEMNPFWYQEFVDYRGLKSVDDLPKMSPNRVCFEKLSRTELEHFLSLIKSVKPLVKDNVCFQLMSLIMMFDTSNLIEEDDDDDEDDDGDEGQRISTTTRVESKRKFSCDDSNEESSRNYKHDNAVESGCILDLSLSSSKSKKNNCPINSTDFETPDNHHGSFSSNRVGANQCLISAATRKQRRRPDPRFATINRLQGQYIKLLQRRFILSNDPLLKKLSSTVQLRRTMNSFRLMAQYFPLIM